MTSSSSPNTVRIGSGDGETWSVGDRFWTPHDGTLTVHRFRVTGLEGVVEALVAPGWLPHSRRWQVMAEGHVRLAQDEPDRPAIGLQSTAVGEAVYHYKFGLGVVVETLATPDGLPAALIEFDTRFGCRAIVLGGGHLMPWCASDDDE